MDKDEANSHPVYFFKANKPDHCMLLIRDIIANIPFFDAMVCSVVKAQLLLLLLQSSLALIA
jgi:hypothetical protein